MQEIATMSTSLLTCLDDVLGCLRLTEDSLQKSVQLQENCFSKREQDELESFWSPCIDLLRFQQVVLTSLQQINRSKQKEMIFNIKHEYLGHSV